MIEGEIRIGLTLEIHQTYQETVESDANTIFKLEQINYQLAVSIVIFNFNKGHEYLDITVVEEVLYVYNYPLLVPMVFDTGVSDGFVKMMEATLLGDIYRLHKCTKDPLIFPHEKSKYGHPVAIPASITQG